MVGVGRFVGLFGQSRSSSWLKSISVSCLMDWRSCDNEMLKQTYLVRWVGGLIDRGHGGVLIRGKTRWFPMLRWRRRGWPGVDSEGLSSGMFLVENDINENEVTVMTTREAWGE